MFLYQDLILLLSLSMIKFNSDSRKRFSLLLLVLEQGNLRQEELETNSSASESISGRGQVASEDRDIVSGGK